MTGNILKQAPMPQPPKHFMLIWKSDDSTVMLYKVVDESEG
jgi:hypothetical protein